MAMSQDPGASVRPREGHRPGKSRFCAGRRLTAHPSEMWRMAANESVVLQSIGDAFLEAVC